MYVLGVAFELLQPGIQVGVLTQERRDRPQKISATTTCGHLGMPMPAFLQSCGFYTIYPPADRGQRCRGAVGVKPPLPTGSMRNGKRRFRRRSIQRVLVDRRIS